MSTSGVGAVGAAGYYAAMANAVKAMGSIIKLDPEEFQKVPGVCLTIGSVQLRRKIESESVRI